MAIILITTDKLKLDDNARNVSFWSYQTSRTTALVHRQNLQFCRCSQKIPHSSPVRTRYGVSFVDPASDWYSAHILGCQINVHAVNICHVSVGLGSTLTSKCWSFFFYMLEVTKICICISWHSSTQEMSVCWYALSWKTKLSAFHNHYHGYSISVLRN